jgi:hypothetical protein
MTKEGGGPAVTAFIAVAAVVTVTLMFLSAAPVAQDDGSLGAVGDTFTDGNFNFRVTSESPDEVTLISYIVAPVGHLDIPATAENSGVTYTVVSIADGTQIGAAPPVSAFYNCTGITSVTIPDTVVRIGNYVFYNCTGMGSIDLGSVTSIGLYAFCGAGLTSVTIPDTVGSVGVYAFYKCNSLGSVTMTGAPVIGDYMFSECRNLTSVDLGRTTRIAQHAFNTCGMETIVIPDSVTNIEDGAFMDCAALKTMTIPDSVTYIGFIAVRGTDVKTVAIPAGANVRPNAFPAVPGEIFTTVKIYYTDVPVVTAVWNNAASTGLLIPEPTGLTITEVVLEDYTPSTGTIGALHDQFSYGDSMSFDPDGKLNFYLTVTASTAEYDVIVNGSNIDSYTPSDTSYGESGLTVTIEPETGYRIIGITSITMDGDALVADVDYTYADGTVTFIINVYGEVVIDALTGPIVYDVTVTETSDIGGDFEYTVAWNGNPTYMQGTFTLGPGGSHTIQDVPHGAAIRVEVTLDVGHDAIWNEATVRSDGPVIIVPSVTGAIDMTVKIVPPVDGGDDAPMWAWIALALIGVLFLLMFLDDDEEVYGKVTHNGKGVAGVAITYTLNGATDTAITDGDGDYSISVDKGDDIVIANASKDDLAASELPISLHIAKDRTRVDVTLSK